MFWSRAFLAVALLAPLSVNAASVAGELKLWHKVTVEVAGPPSTESSAVNPFRDFRMDVTFTPPGNGAPRTVPGYFAADGNAGESGATSGTVWRAHFTPDQTGAWSYSVAFKTGKLVAIDGGGAPASADDGATGAFNVGVRDRKSVG